MDDFNAQKNPYRFWQYCFERRVTLGELLAMKAGLSAQHLELYVTYYWAILGLNQLNVLRANFELEPVGTEFLFDKLLGAQKLQAILFGYLNSGAAALDGVNQEFLHCLLESVRTQLKSCFVSRKDLAIICRFVLLNLVKKNWIKVGDRFDWPEDSLAGLIKQDRWTAEMDRYYGATSQSGANELTLPAVSWVTSESGARPAAFSAVSPAVKVDFLSFAAYWGARECFAKQWNLQSASSERRAQDYGKMATIGGQVDIFKLAAQQPVAFKRCCFLAINLGRQQILEYLISHGPYTWRDMPLEWYVTGFASGNQQFLDRVWPHINLEQQRSISTTVIKGCYADLCAMPYNQRTDQLFIGRGMLLNVYLSTPEIVELADDFNGYATEETFWHMLAAFDAGSWVVALQDADPSLKQSINQQDKLGRSAILLAAQMEHLHVTSELLQIPGIEIDTTDIKQHTARQLIANNGWMELLSGYLNEFGRPKNSLLDGSENGNDGDRRDEAAIKYLTSRKRMRL